MKDRLTRRQFLTVLGGGAAGAVVFQACGVPEQELLVQSPLEMPEDLVTGLDNWYATLCRQCPTSEGVVVRVMEGRAKKVEGNVDYPINRGKHSARCEAGLQDLYHPDRISGPLVRVGERGAGQWDEISWSDAIGRLVHQLDLLQQSGDQTGMVMVTDPVGSHLGTVVESFVSRFGGRHMPYEPLERTNLRAAMKQVYGQDVMPDFDIENTSYLLSFGADFLGSWISPVRYARGYGQFRQGDRERGTFVQVESRFSMTAASADRWLFVRPGMEGELALSMAQVIVSEGLGNRAAAEALTSGGLNLGRFAPEIVTGNVGVPAERIREVARDFAAHRPALAIGGGSAAAHTNGLFNLQAIYSLNYLVESVGVPGGVIFNPPPALENVPRAPATASYSQWQQLVADMNRGDVKVMMVRGADPMYGIPGANRFGAATFKVPFIFSFSGHMDDTTAMADLVLPEHSYLEDWGSDVPDPGPGYQTVGFQQPVVRPFFEGRGEHLGTRNFAEVLMSAAQALELDLGLKGQTFKDILKDGALQLFDKGDGSVTASSFSGFWNGVLQRGGWWDTGAVSTAGPAGPPALPSGPPAARFDRPSGAGRTFHLIPFASTSLGDGSGARLPWLQAAPDPITTAVWRTWVEINIGVAREMGIEEGDVVRVISTHGRDGQAREGIEALAYPHPGMSPDVVSIPVGQGHSAGGRYAENRGSNVLSILAPDLVDDETGALAWAATRVRIEKTGNWERLPKFENTKEQLAEDEERAIIEITPNDT